MKKQTLFAACVVSLAASLATAVAAPAADAEKTVKVFILAGQSNMEGKAANTLLDHQATDPKTRDFFAHLRDRDKWAVRDDVFIKFLGRKGPLTIGYGSPDRTGAELWKTTHRDSDLSLVYSNRIRPNHTGTYA